MVQLGKMPMDCAVTAEDQGGREVFNSFQAVEDFYLNTAASKAIDYLGRHLWVKQRGCDHEEEIPVKLN